MILEVEITHGQDPQAAEWEARAQVENEYLSGCPEELEFIQHGFAEDWPDWPSWPDPI